MLLDYSIDFTLRESDFDCFRNIKASAVLDLFQTVAAEHAELFGGGFEATLARNVAWVVTKIKFDALLPLRSGEKVTVRTVPHPKRLAFYARDYFVTNERGELAIKGTSQWVLIDFTSRKITRDPFEFDGEFVEEYAYPNERFEKVELVPPTEPLYSHEVCRADVDHNRHVNNARYLDMVLCAEPNPSLPVASLSVNYVEEVKAGETVLVYGENGTYSGYAGDSPRFSVKLVRKNFD